MSRAKKDSGSDSDGRLSDHGHDGTVAPYKTTHTYAERIQEVEAIRRKFPQKIPIIIERYRKEKNLPLLDRQKFLVPSAVTMSQFVTIVRSRLALRSNQSLYFLIAGRAVASMSLTLAELYHDFADPDGFLYITYASQEVFG